VIPAGFVEGGVVKMALIDRYIFLTAPSNGVILWSDETISPVLVPAAGVDGVDFLVLVATDAALRAR
jgi:hypothetical protein